MIGAILASLGTLRSAFKLRIALIASHHWSTVCRAVSSDQPSGRGQAAMQTLSAAACRLGQPAHRRQAVQALPDLFGHKRHDRMEQAAEPIEQRRQHALGDRTAAAVAQAALDELEVPVAEVAPREIAQLAGGLGELELLQGRRHFADRSIQAIDDPAILDRQVLAARVRRLVALQIHQGEPGGVPELVGEIAPQLEPLGGVDDAAVGRA